MSDTRVYTFEIVSNARHQSIFQCPLRVSQQRQWAFGHDGVFWAAALQVCYLQAAWAVYMCTSQTAFRWFRMIQRCPASYKSLVAHCPTAAA